VINRAGDVLFNSPCGPTVSLIGQGNWSACSLLIQSFIFRVKKMPKELEKGFAVAYRLEMNCFVCLCYLGKMIKLIKVQKKEVIALTFPDQLIIMK
jgi:hypothetical protein